MSDKTSDVVFLETLLQRVPELAPIYAAELTLMEGELTLHGILWRVASFAQEAQLAIGFIRGPIRGHLDLTIDHLLTAMEEGIQNGDKAVKDAVLTGFLESIGNERYREVYEAFVARLGPGLTEGLEALNRFWGGPPKPT